MRRITNTKLYMNTSMAQKISSSCQTMFRRFSITYCYGASHKSVHDLKYNLQNTIITTYMYRKSMNKYEPLYQNIMKHTSVTRS